MFIHYDCFLEDFLRVNLVIRKTNYSGAEATLKINGNTNIHGTKEQIKQIADSIYVAIEENELKEKVKA